MPRLFTWQNSLRMLGAGGFIYLLQSPDEKIVYMLACLALATFGLPGAIRFDQRRRDDEDE